MLSRTWIVSVIGFASTWIIAQSAAAAIWSIEADCEEGDWVVEIEFAGYGAIDASCADGKKRDFRVDAGDLGVQSALIAVTSASGTSCSSETGGEPRFKLACSEKAEDSQGIELEEEIEVELERLDEWPDADEDFQEE